jgi:hypothetical protein
VKQRFNHGEMFGMNLPNGVASASRAAVRNQPCCIKIVKWFYPTLVEQLENFGNKRLVEFAQGGDPRLWVSVSWKTFSSQLRAAVAGRSPHPP